MILDAKDPNVSAEYGIDFHDAVVVEAARRTSFAQGAIVHYPRDTGFYYEVTTAGRTSSHYPAQLPRAAGETLQDGSAVLTCRLPSEVSLAAISSVDWTADAGITVASQRTDGLVAYVTLSGGTDGVDYDVLCRMTPSSGNIIEKTIVVPVRAQ